MKVIILLIVMVAAVASTNVEKWTHFKIKFGKTYPTEAEEAKRFSIFEDNLRIIEAHNQRYLNGETKHKMGITRFVDKTQEEFFDKENTRLPKFNKFNLEPVHPLDGYCSLYFYKPNLITSTTLGQDDPPASIDYRDKGVILPPRDIGDRLADHAFAIAANLEASLALYNGTVEYLSPQYILDCCDYGIYAGYARAFYNGLPSEKDYPLLEEGTGECRELCNGACFGYSILLHESIIETVVGLVNPVTIWFDGGDLALYESGIIDGSNCYYNPDEWIPDPSKWRKAWNGVIVGYGTENGTDYWIIKNSWGTSWGENGYFRLIRGQLACGIEAYPVAPHIEDPLGECPR